MLARGPHGLQDGPVCSSVAIFPVTGRHPRISAASSGEGRGGLELFDRRLFFFFFFFFFSGSQSVIKVESTLYGAVYSRRRQQGDRR